ncbi:hypothetical protein KJ632_01145, partial [Patescibacteria group bacterium]|nr:hypothetical protein [Patescibacteria group bacterium]
VFPKEFADEEDIYPPVGTAPYIFSQWQKGEKIVFENNPDYWGDIGKYGQVEIFGRSDKFERVDLLTEQGADFLAFTPFDAVSALEDAGFKTVAIPSLEVQFLIFNFDSKIFKDSQARKMISLAIDPNDLVDLVGGFATASTQFVSNGILGFSPKLAEHQYNLLEAEKIANEFELKGRTIKFTLSKGLDVLGEYVREQMRKIGVRVIVSYLDGAELYESMFAGDSDFYFLAFKSDFGDASSFYDVLVHSLGEFNIAKYRDEFVDKLIEESRVEMDASIRRKNLQKIMEILVGDNFGVPLFEYETVYSMPQNVSITPRIDGFIYFDDIKIENGI